MKTVFINNISIFLFFSTILAACASPAISSLPEGRVQGQTEAVETSATVSQETDSENLVLEETKTTLLVYSGDVRVSHDDGDSWFYADTGLWLESGDRIQVAEGGLALIVFPDGSLIRLEGFTDFRLVLNEFDFEQGSKRVIGRVWEGAALASTTPLPSQNSLFQLWSMTTFIDLPYDAANSVPLDSVDTIDEEERIIFGASIREEEGGESLVSYSAHTDLYALEMVDGDVVLVKTRPQVDQFTQYDLPFRDEIEDEFELEGLLDIAASLVDANHSAESFEDLDVYGYSMVEEGPIDEDQMLYSVFDVAEMDEFIREAENPDEKKEYVRSVSSSPAYSRHKMYYRYYKRIADIFSPEILMQLEKYNKGCDIRTGLGCAIPEGCDRESGEGCEFTSGCNIITREGCDIPYIHCVVYTNCDWAPCGVKPVIQTFCKPVVRTYCDPDIAGDCDKYLKTSLPLNVVQNPEKAGGPLCDPNTPGSCAELYNEEFWKEYDEWDEDENIEWCTCIAKVPPGYPPPPPSMDMTYRCWCSDPGAIRD